MSVPNLITRVLENREHFPAKVRGDVIMETGSEKCYLLPLKMEGGDPG